MWPISERLKSLASQFKSIIVVEMNDGQLFNLLKAESIQKLQSLTQVSGKPIRVSYLLEKFQKISPNNSKSVIVDLAVPNDCDIKISENKYVKLINVDQLKVRAEENLQARGEEIKRCLDIIERQIIKYYIAEKERNLERALSSVPKSIKGIRQKAFREVFAKELETLDPGAIKVVNSLVDYIEKKYISVPMKMAKEILLKETTK